MTSDGALVSGTGIRRSARAGRGRANARLTRPLAAVGAVILLIGGAYIAARETSVFAVRQVEVVGALPGDVEAQVHQVLGAFEGQSLVAVDAAAVEDALEKLPPVVQASVDRDFPATLQATVRLEKGIAVLRQGARAWLVSASGRVLEELEPDDLTRLPRVWLPRSQALLAAGTTVLPEEGGVAIEAVSRIPDGFPLRVEAAGGTPDELHMILGNDTEIRLGDTAELRLKLEVAGVVLRALTATEREALAYLDVSVPTRVVLGEKSQVES